MRSCGRLFLTALLAPAAVMGHSTASRPGGGGLTIEAPPSLAAISAEYDIANFKYYGPQDSVVSGPAVVLDGEALCYPDKSVKGMIVIIGDWRCGVPASSRMDALYEKHQEQGALALILVTKSTMLPPGKKWVYFFSLSRCVPVCVFFNAARQQQMIIIIGEMYYNYESWDRCRFCFDGKKNTMPLFQVNSVAGSQMPVWRKQEELHLRLEPPERNQLQEMFASTTWLILFQILLPCMAFLTAIDALFEISRILRRSSNVCGCGSWTLERSNEVSLVVCCLEAPSMILFGLALALGLYGPKSVPLSAIGSATPAYQGIGASTNVIVSIYLMEESKAFRFGNSSLERSPLFVRYKYTARLLVCAFALPDIVAIFLVNQNGLYQSSHTFFVMANLILHFSAATCK